MNNPFQSPNESSPSTFGDNRAGRPHLLWRLFFGWFFGGVFGAFFAMVGGILIAGVYLLTANEGAVISQGAIAMIFMDSAIAGLICGSFSGAMIGPFVTLTVAGLGSRARRFLDISYLASACSAITGALAGMAAHGLLSAHSFEQSVVAAAFHGSALVSQGSAIGLVTGAIGGWCLGLFLKRWNR